MKKLFFATAALCAAATISAQEVVESQAEQATATEAPTKTFKGGSDRFGAEVGLSLGNGFSLSGGNLNFNYTLSDELMLRLGFGLNVNKHCGSTDKTEGHDTESAFDVKPGITYSFSGTNRLEPYIGAELLFGLNSSCEYSKFKEDGESLEVEDRTRNARLGANALTGFNFYVAKDLYVGAEVGLGFVVSPNTHKFGKNEEGKEYDSKDTDVKGHSTNISAQCNPSIRVGWKF